MNPNRALAGERSSETRRRRRRAAQDHGRALARSGDPLHLTGCMLYWAEGTKNKNRASLTNSDPAMLRVFVRFLQACYDVPLDRMQLRVNCFLGNGLGLDEIESWWLDKLGLPPSCLRAATVNNPSSASKRRRPPLIYGTACVSLGSTFVVQSIFGAIQEYTGEDRPEWLDIGSKPRTALTVA